MGKNKKLNLQMYSGQNVSSVILAAGRATRMGSRINKVYMELGGKPVILYSVEKFLANKLVDDVIVVINENDKELAAKVFERANVKEKVRIVLGGDKRQDSSLNGILETDSDYAFVHDAARPNFSEGLIEKLIKAAYEQGAAIPGVRPIDTIRKVSDELAGNCVNRDEVVNVQTPQCFYRLWLEESLKKSVENNNYHTDDAGAIKAVKGVKSKVITGDRSNLKLTCPEDFLYVEAFLKSE